MRDRAPLLAASRVIARRIADALLAILVAPPCVVCDAPLENPTRGCVCGSCWDSIRPITAPACDGCGEALPSWRTTSIIKAVCPRCRRMARSIDRLRAIGEYEGALRAVIHALKYDGRRSLAAPLAVRMREAAGGLLDEVDVVVPVPLHRRKQRERGFNQAEELAKRLGPPMARVLRRTRATPSQTGLPSAQRHRNVRGAFALAGVETESAMKIRNRLVLLVDDVSTTGATLEACARVLRQAGAREIRAITAAKVPTRRR